ncbi:MAG: hypothetical protein KTR27_20350 [Leptolyngbyaceae cyanobacterium MAG.088]|nr:hypothetical protein [Leptolyngbyaceae cyanobacterium MAG.088]
MLKQQRVTRVALNLLTLLAVVSNGWLYAIPRVMAEADSAETIEMVDDVAQQPTLDRAVARQLLEQIKLATNDLQDNHSQTQVLSAIARSYSAMSDDTTALAILNQMIIHSNDDPNTQLSNLYPVLNTASSFSNETVTVDLLHQLLDATQQLPTDNDKSSFLSQITYFANQLTDQSAVDDIMRQIIAISQTAEASSGKARTLTNAAGFYISITDDAEAMDLLSQALVAINKSDIDEHTKYYALLEILYHSAEFSSDTTKADMLNQTLTVINDLKSQEFKSQALVYASLLAQALSDTPKANQLMAEALALAEAIPEGWAKASALYVIAGNYKDEFNQQNTKDLLSRVLNAVGEIQEDQYQLGGLLDVVHLAGQLSNQTVSRELLTQALAIINGFESGFNQAQGLLSIAESYRAISDEVAAREVLLQVLTLASDIEEPYSQRIILQQFASLSTRLTDSDISQDIVSQALTFVNAEQDVERRAIMLMTLTETYQETLAGINAPEQISQALMLVEAMQEPDAKAEALSQAAQILYHRTFSDQAMTDWSQIQTLLGQVLESSRDLPDSEEKMFTFLMLEYAINELPPDVAAPLTEQFISVAKRARTVRGKVMALSAIAKIQINQNQHTAAQQTLAQAISIVSDIQDPNHLTSAIYRISEVTGTLSENSAIHSLTNQILAIVADIEDDTAKVSGINAALSAMQQLSDGQMAQQLFNQTFAIVDTLETEVEGYKTNIFRTMATVVMVMASSDW